MLNTVPIMIGTTMTHRLITVLLILSALRAQTLLRPVRPLVPAPTLCVAAPTGLPALLGAAPALPRFCKLPEYPSSGHAPSHRTSFRGSRVEGRGSPCALTPQPSTVNPEP